MIKLAILLTLLATIASAQQPARAGSISGVVTIDGKPAPGIGVCAMVDSNYTEPTVAAIATTDKEGRYTLDGLAAGDYQVVADAVACFLAGQRRPWKPGISVTVGDREPVDNVALDLVRGGVITGRLYDANGQPIVREEVQITAIDENGRHMPTSEGFSDRSTDDRGVYRAYGLSPGRYLVSSGVRDDGSGTRYGTTARPYPETFYPGVTDRGRATPVEVTAGGEATGIDIPFGRLSQVFVASGRAVDENGAPVTGISCGCSRVVDGDVQGWISGDVRSNDRGEFQCGGLAPGTYAVIVTPDDSNSWYGSPVSFEIADHDAGGLVLVLRKGVSVSGTVVFEGPADRDASRASNFVVTLWPTATVRERTSDTQFAGKSTEPDAGGGFRMQGIRPGKYRVGIYNYGESKGLTVVRIERGGQPASAEIEVGSDADVDGIVLMVATGTGSVRGRVAVSNGTLPFERVVVEFQRAGVSAQKQRVSLDDRGQFVVTGLAAGEYEFSATGYAGDGPANRKVHSADARITVADGAASDVLLTIDLQSAEPEKP